MQNETSKLTEAEKEVMAGLNKLVAGLDGSEPVTEEDLCPENKLLLDFVMSERAAARATALRDAMMTIESAASRSEAYQLIQKLLEAP